MGEIYRQAKRVCAWLGEATNVGSEPFLELDVEELLEVAINSRLGGDRSSAETEAVAFSTGCENAGWKSG